MKRTANIDRVLSILAVIIGIALSVALMYESRQIFGLPLGEGSLDGVRLRFFAWIAATAVSIVAAFMAARVLARGVVAGTLLLLRRCSADEAWALTRYGKFPGGD